MLYFSQIVLLFPVFVTFIWFISFSFSRVSLKNPRFIMALFMGTAFITFLSGIGIYGNLISLYRIIYPFVFFTALSLFPLFYIYVYQIINPNKISSGLFIHFIPAVILFALSITLFGIMMSETEQFFYIHNFLLAPEPPAEMHWKFVAMKFVDKLAKRSYIILSVIYYIVTYRMVNRHQKIIEDYYSALKGVSLNWVKALAIFFVLALLAGITVHWFKRYEILNSPFLSSVPFIFLGTFFAVVGNYGNRQVVAIFPPEKMDEDESENQLIKKEIPDEKESSHSNKEEQVQRPGLKEKIELYFKEYRPYLNPELKIWDIARGLNTNRTYISQLINQEYGVRFSYFINKYRIEEAKRIINNPKTKNYSLTVIANMSGFLNYSSFVRAFKLIEGTTPNEFRQEKCEINQ